MYAAVRQPYTLSASSPNVTPTTEDAPCRLWQSKEANGSCKCHIGENLYVACEDDPYYLGVYQCYCVTERQGKTMVSPCLYTCHSTTHTYLNITAHSMAEINEEVCGPYNREGAMCARCKPNHSPPVYSYSLHCVNCTSSNWGKFLAVSLLPSTAFFVLVLLFSISATSPNLNGFIFFCQILTSANTMRLLQVSLANLSGYTQWQRIIVKLFVSLAGVWRVEPGFSPPRLHPILPPARHRQLHGYGHRLSRCSVPTPPHRSCLHPRIDVRRERSCGCPALQAVCVPLHKVQERMEHQILTSGCLRHLPPPLLCQDSQCVHRHPPPNSLLQVPPQPRATRVSLLASKRSLLRQQPLSFCLPGRFLPPHFHSATNAAPPPLSLLLFPGMSQPHWLPLSGPAHLHGRLPGTLQEWY